LVSSALTNEVHEPMSAAMPEFNGVIGLFDFILSRNQFVNRLRLTLLVYLTLSLPQDKLCIPCAVVHGLSYGLTYSVDVIVASSTHCRNRNYPLLASFFFYFICICMCFVFVVLSITKIDS
jgi:hypothetical protein